MFSLVLILIRVMMKYIKNNRDEYVNAYGTLYSQQSPWTKNIIRFLTVSLPLYALSYCGNEGLPSKTSEFLIESHLNDFGFHRPLNFCIFLGVWTSLFGMVNFILSKKIDQHSSSYRSLCNHPYNIFEWFTTFELISVTQPWRLCTNLGLELVIFNRM